MTKQLRLALGFLAACVLFALVMTALSENETSRGNKVQLHISAVVYGTADRWTSLEQGLVQAASTLNMQAPTLVTADTRSPEAQLAVIEREIASGADALLIATNDSEALREPLQALAETIPIIFVETGVGGALEAVQADNTAMAKNLAATLHGKENIVVLDQNRSRDSVDERYRALLDALDAQGDAYHVWNQAEHNVALSSFLLRNMMGQGYVTLVTLDAEGTEAAIDALMTETPEAERALDTEVALYGVGGTSKIVHALDRGFVTQIWYENEYNLGYIGLVKLAARMGVAAPSLPESIEFIPVSQENMYEADIERLLFPIIQ